MEITLSSSFMLEKREAQSLLSSLPSFPVSLSPFLAHRAGTMLSTGDMGRNDLDVSSDSTEYTSSEHVGHYTQYVITLHV